MEIYLAALVAPDGKGGMFVLDGLQEDATQLCWYGNQLTTATIGPEKRQMKPDETLDREIKGK